MEKKTIELVRKKLYHFINKMIREGNSVSLFSENLKTLSIIEGRKNEYFGGEYFTVDNVLILYNPDGALYHELLHCASNRKDDVYIMDGFYFCTQDENDRDKPLGEGLNEAFTEYLSREYFNDPIYDITLDFYISKLIDVIGFEKMKKFYFNADLFGVFKEFSKYINEDKIYTFMDHIDELFEATKPGLDDDLMAQQESMEICSEILLEAYVNKIKNSNISKEEKLNKLFNFIATNPKIEFISYDETLTTYPSYEAIKKSFLNIGVGVSKDFYQVLKKYGFIFPEEVLSKSLKSEESKK